MRKIILFSLSIFIFASLFAQYDSLWAKTYGGFIKEEGFSAIQTRDSSYLLGGYTNSFGAGLYDYWIIKGNADGDTLWTKTYGGPSYEMCYSIIETHDSCYMFAGQTKSYGAGNYDFWLVKTNADGDTLWTKTYGGAYDEICYSIIETRDSCYLLAGQTDSYGAGDFDIWLIKIDSSGDTIWTKTYGGTSTDDCKSIIQSTDSGYVLCGSTLSYGGNSNYWLLKINTDGDTLWTRRYGGTDMDMCNSVIETSDGGYLMVGNTYSYGAGNTDYWAVKTNMDGDTLWTKTYGGTDYEECYSVIETDDSCYMMTGYSKSYGAGDADAWIVTIHSNGDTLWTKVYGGAMFDCFRKVINISDASYLFVGSTNSFGAGGLDFWAMDIIDLSLNEFTIVPNNYISADSACLSWHPSDCNVPFSYECNFNGIVDTVSQSDTTYLAGNLTEGRYVWYVTGINDYGYRTRSDNTDTFWVDRTPPAVLAVENIPDTNYSGPYELRIMAEDTIAGIDSIVVLYLLPGDTIWGRTAASDITWKWYTGYIPEVSQTGYVYYYLELYDKAVPSNHCRYPDYPRLFSFEVTGLTGITDKSDITYALDIRQFSNTGIMFTLPDNSPVSITVYDINGRVVLNKAITMPKGSHTVNLDINPGVYFVKVNTLYGSAEQKIINIK